MTYIEFFEKDAADNLCACLAQPPERVVLVGPQTKVMRRHAERYQSVLARRGCRVEFLYRAVNPNRLGEIVDALTELVETYDDCAFGLTGGEDLCLVAMGIVFERFRNRGIQMHRFNLRGGAVIDCDQDGRTCFTGAAPALSVEENIRVYGGDVVYEDTRPEGTVRWDLSGDLLEDIDAMWEVCRRDVRLWNAQMGVLAAAEMLRDETREPLNTSLYVSYLEEYLEWSGEKYVAARNILQGLYRAGVLTDFACDDDYLSVTYKNEQVKRCMLKAGQVLEMKIFSTARRAAEPDGSPTYNDVMTGVFIDWDGELHQPWEAGDTENEIDVILMHGMVPVFVSCKNGAVEMGELYKLSAVADRFGGKYAKKVLVATALDSQGVFAEYFRQRAREMQIRLVEGVQDLSEPELRRVVRSFWGG